MSGAVCRWFKGADVASFGDHVTRWAHDLLYLHSIYKYLLTLINSFWKLFPDKNSTSLKDE